MMSPMMFLQIPTTTVRILLNHFKWDKEKLMERFYSDHQEAMFDEAQVMSRYKKNPNLPKRPSSASSVVECEICCLSLT
jgi:ariadne-1